jgi:hypothetical protein
VRLKIFVGVLVLAALGAGVATASIRPLRPADEALLKRAPTAEERVAEQVARRLTQKEVKVRCGTLGIAGAGWTGGGIAGITLFESTGKPAGYALLLPQVCAQLVAFRRAPKSWDPSRCTDESSCAAIADAALALATVTHESYHLLGYQNEGQVECYGMQSIWYAAAKLGASPSEAQRLARFYAAELYPLRKKQTPLYWSAECRDGGKYDLRPNSHGWPS